MSNKYIAVKVALSFSIVLFAAVVAAGLPEKTDNAYNITGCWFGSHQQAGIDGDIQNISCFKSDNTFLIRFRVIQNGRQIGEQTESGTWELKGNIKTMVTTHINQEHLDKDQYITDRYLMLGMDGSELHYEHLTSGTKYKAIRVSNEFNFP